MNHNIQVEFKPNYDRTGTTMFVYFQDYNGKMNILKEISNEKVGFEIFDVGALHKGIYLPPDIFRAIVDQVLHDFKAPNSTFVEGKLAGVEKHLADMRTLLKLK
jgi:hypothetical protein